MFFLKNTNNKRIGLWLLYDFANSLAFANLSFYFTLWLVEDRNFSDMWVSIPAALATVCLLLTIPHFGSLSDRTGKRMVFLRTFSWLSIACLFLIGLTALLSESKVMVAVVVVLYFCFLYFYQSSLVFYDAMLPTIAEGKSKERISGFGMAFGQTGNAVGIVLALLFVGGTFSFFGAEGRPVAFILGSILFLILSLPTLLFLKDSQSVTAHALGKEKPFKQTILSLKKIYQNKPAFNFLIVYFLFSDALLTLQLFITLYLQIVGGFSDTAKTILGAVGLLCAVFGALLSSFIARIFKSTHRAIKILIMAWALCIMTLALAHSQMSFIVAIILNGIVFGSLYPLSRAYYSDLAPKENQAEFFSVYSLFEKSASIAGPLIWSSVVLAFAYLGEVTKYRFAMLSLAVLVLVSFFIFKSKHETQS